VRPAGSARANLIRLTPADGYQPNPFIILRGREKRIEIHATSIVVATTLRTDVFTATRWCRFASWVWNSFNYYLIGYQTIEDRGVEESQHGPRPAPHLTSVTSQIIAAEKNSPFYRSL
jgi:hypothetical protein